MSRNSLLDVPLDRGHTLTDRSAIAPCPTSRTAVAFAYSQADMCTAFVNRLRRRFGETPHRPDLSVTYYCRACRLPDVIAPGGCSAVEAVVDALSAWKRFHCRSAACTRSTHPEFLLQRA
jgi:hypothetical protein